MRTSLPETEHLNTGDAPLVSVLVPCYNYAQYVVDALQSILAQDYPNFELIIVDDGSTDDSVQVIERVLSNIESTSLVRRVEFIRQSNQGVSAALNAALLSAKGEFVVTFDADDVMPAGRLTLQINYLREQPLVGCLGGAFIRIDEQGNLVARKNKKRKIHRYNFSQVLSSALVVGGGMAAYRREAIELAGGYNPDIRIQDFQITLNVAHAGFFVDILPDVVTYYRQHGYGLSKKYKSELCYGLQVIEVFKDRPEYEAARVHLIERALKIASIYDKQYAWGLIKKVPLRYWDRVMLRRVRYFLFKRSKSSF